MRILITMCEMSLQTEEGKEEPPEEKDDDEEEG